MSEMQQCEICGLTYISPIDNHEHARRHGEFVKLSDAFAVPRFGKYLWTYGRREVEKRHPKRTIEDCERHLYAWFCRSVERDHPSFEDYAALMLAPMPDKPSTKLYGDLFGGFIDELRRRYPWRPGMQWAVEPGKSKATREESPT